ncbi:MAG: hypothetical protein EOP22_18000 [Hyphomicrobiales bacterium]|nr:MAG: hypothetical protein EOP22_18000 [Hyphomicrobiales bacterium]
MHPSTHTILAEMASRLREDTLTPLKERILALVRDETTPTLAAVARLPGAHGEKCLTITGKNVVLWGAFSWDAISAIRELQLEGRIRLEPTLPLVYLAEGIAPRLPLVKSHRAIARGYAQPHWLPVVLVAGAA